MVEKGWGWGRLVLIEGKGYCEGHGGEGWGGGVRVGASFPQWFWDVVKAGNQGTGNLSQVKCQNLGLRKPVVGDATSDVLCVTLGLWLKSTLLTVDLIVLD